MERTLDRIPHFDPLSRNYPIRALIETTKQPRSYTWACDTYNDQGQEGACVGFSWSHELAARPKIVPASEADAQRIYHRAQQLDPWPGEDYEGTAVIAGAKAVMEMKNSLGQPLLKEYRWAFSLDDLILAVGYRGPAVLGINWWSDMWDTGPNGYVTPTGQVVGGHAILARAVRVIKKDPLQTMTWGNLDYYKSYITLHNSWGKYWGYDGLCKVRLQDMGKLLSDDGEACIPLVRSYA